MRGTATGPDLESITELIERANDGDKDALNRLFTSLYAELHALARSRVHRNTPITLLDTTALLHESYLRLTKLGVLKVSSRAHFLAYAARAMRSIIVDYGRQRLAERRGGGAREVTLDTESAQSLSSGEAEVLRVHEALEELAAIDGRVVRVVEMRYFGGLTEDDIAEALGVTTRTVQRDWEKARLLLSIALR
ncbi:MAG TPA: ECF-type sigma factor [Casimicrobiaceae bacterium]|nr:ECF-type sigma factor [Casimicrobiaceae bacterium]